MIRHIVSWKLNTEGEAKLEAATQIADSLRALVGEVPQIKSLSIGPDAVGNGNWDLALVADFDSVDDLTGYIEHPAHQALVPFIRSHIAERSCVDFEF
ncbi:MAG: Dabb family protein [Microbacteriaceae bacterium]